MVIKAFLCLVWFFIYPLLIGYIFTYLISKKSKENKKERKAKGKIQSKINKVAEKKEPANNIRRYITKTFYSIIYGYIIEFAIAQILIVAFSFLRFKYIPLFILVCVIYTLIALIGLKLILKANKSKIKQSNIKEISKQLLKSINNIWTISAIILILLQCYVGFAYMHIDEDDSNFVAKATTAIDTNTLYELNDGGVEVSKLPYRNGLSPFPIYTAFCSTFCNLRPMTIAHTIMPVVFTLLVNITNYLLALKMFKTNKYASCYLTCLNLVYMFGNVSTRINFTRIYIRLWQGKTILCEFFIPALLLLYIDFMENANELFTKNTIMNKNIYDKIKEKQSKTERKITKQMQIIRLSIKQMVNNINITQIYIIILSCLSCGAGLVSTMGFAIIPIEFVFLCFIYFILDMLKNLKAIIEERYNKAKINANNANKSDKSIYKNIYYIYDNYEKEPKEDKTIDIVLDGKENADNIKIDKLNLNAKNNYSINITLKNSDKQQKTIQIDEINISEDKKGIKKLIRFIKENITKQDTINSFNKSKVIIFNTLICLVPTLIYAILYILLKKGVIK